MKEPSRQKENKFVTRAVCTAIILGFILLVSFVFAYRKETHIYGETSIASVVSALVCTSNNNELAFFSDNAANSVEHKVKLVYKDGRLNKISYELTGEYDSEEAARVAQGGFNTDYNIYLGKYNLKYELLAPVFQYAGNKASVKLYLDDYRNMNSVVSGMFCIDSTSVEAIAENSIEETKKYYEDKDFVCAVNE